MPDTKSFNEASRKSYTPIADRIRNTYLLQTYDSLENPANSESPRRAAEKLLLSYISMGNVALADKLIEDVLTSDFSMPVGELSKNPLHQARYSIVAAVTLFSRQAIDAGLPEHMAYSISDSYIQHADKSQNAEEIYYLFFQSFREYCQVVQQWRVHNKRPELRACCEYIAAHMHEKISLEDLSRVCHMTPNYVSDLFQKELGIRPKQYILREKLNYAAFILRSTEAPIAEVAALLAFSSPSAFTGHFQTQYGVLPSQYRQQEQSI